MDNPEKLQENKCLRDQLKELLQNPKIVDLLTGDDELEKNYEAVRTQIHGYNIKESILEEENDTQNHTQDQVDVRMTDFLDLRNSPDDRIPDFVNMNQQNDNVDMKQQNDNVDIDHNEIMIEDHYQINQIDLLKENEFLRNQLEKLHEKKKPNVVQWVLENKDDKETIDLLRRQLFSVDQQMGSHGQSQEDDPIFVQEGSIGLEAPMFHQIDPNQERSEYYPRDGQLRSVN